MIRQNAAFDSLRSPPSVNNPERTHVAGILRRQELRDGGHRLAARAAVRLDERAGGRAEPGAADGVAEQLEERDLELAGVADLDRRFVIEERRRDLGEILHVRPEHDRLAEDRRLEDVVPPLVDEAAA